jgi:microcystin-dependent protein
VALDDLQMPAHNHLIAATTMPGTVSTVQGSLLATITDAPNPAPAVYGPLNPPITLDQTSLTTAGQGQPHENMQPFTVLQYCINVVGGEFPST